MINLSFHERIKNGMVSFDFSSVKYRLFRDRNANVGSWLYENFVRKG